MFKLNDEDARLAAWSSLRKKIDVSEDPLQVLIDFWSTAPCKADAMVLDQYYVKSWPTPWEIVVENRYDDFTKAVMMGYTLLLTEKYKDSIIEIRTFVDKQHNRLYNAVYVNDAWALNISDTEAVPVFQIPDSFKVENIIVLERPR